MFKSKWIRFLPFLPLIVLLLAVNIYGDAGNIFHSPVDVTAEALLAGYPAYVASGNLSERELRYRYICRMSGDVECLIMGASTVMCVTSEDVGEEKFVNLGNSNGRLEDILAYLGTMKLLAKDKHIRRIILGPSEYWFNKKMFDRDYDEKTRQVLKPYTDYMFDTINGKDTADRKFYPADFGGGIYEFNPLFSISYFQANVNYLADTDMLNLQRSGIVRDNKYEGYYYMPDGSWVYGKTVILQNENDVILIAGKHVLDTNLLDRYTEHIDPDLRRNFEKLVQYLIAHEITVEIYLIPLAPALWDRLDTKKHPFFPELEEYLIRIAEKYSLRIIGSYNPYKVGITNADFYDARHVRRGHISRYFDLKAKN